MGSKFDNRKRLMKNLNKFLKKYQEYYHVQVNKVEDKPMLTITITVFEKGIE